MTQAGSSDPRMRVEPGEFYRDLLKADAFCRGNTDAQQADSLLGAKLQERESLIVSKIKYLAWKRGITTAQLWLDIQTGKAKRITPEEIAAYREQGLIDETGDIPGLRELK
ncbi:hypothetical protein [Brasilonema sp. UFV-L1]|uniref:hypothetical protein n=1 Tax=Brasilonema sp. UFV-L1 TaxID=2234130 RepID=UPI00145D0BA1|nr:hypothetical protein [Brasilonema sp. UFV-L1]NMG11860.1 hypothetical protein [Brasilonema sp. UFV-L1]